jgi:hypothetical protein
MVKFEKKLAKMKELDKKGVDYNEEDLVVSDEEGEDDFFESKQKQMEKE